MFLYAPVAQWIEQETSKLLAVGSIPTRGTKIGKKSELRRVSVAFSMAARSADHMVSGGRNAVGAAVGCAFLDFSHHWRF